MINLLAFCLFSGVAIGSGWQAIAAFVNMCSYYLVGVPLGFLLGWLLSFGITVCMFIFFSCLNSPFHLATT